MKIASISLASCLLFFACAKGPGPGGTSTIEGSVIVEDYDQTFSTLWAEYDGADLDVYLIYGDNETYNDHVKTGPNGDFEFTYLQKGTYSVYVYSKDSTLQSPSGQVALITEVTIAENKQTVTVPEFTVFE